MRGERRRRRAFDEHAYLDANPDVAAAVAAGQFASGYEHYERAGRAEGRGFVRPVSRNEIVRSMIDPTGRGIELGPLDQPVVPKREGFDVRIVDYLDTASLRAKYGTDEHPGVDVAAIEEVDVVSRGEPLAELFGGDAAFDWVVAGHVIEHIPDLVAFFQDAERILRPGGRLALLVPDRRYTLDHYGEPTTTGQVLDAHLEGRRRPTPGQAFDHFARAATLDGRIAWSPADAGVPELLHPYEAAAAAYARAIGGDDFGGELHCWRFTPTSFGLLLDDLRALGLVTLGVVDAHDTVGCEFFVALGHRDGPPPADRWTALRADRGADSPRPAGRPG